MASEASGIGGRFQKILVSILIGLLVIAFAVWGINDVFAPQNRNLALSVGDTDIALQDFDTEFRRELRSLSQQNGVGLTNQEAYDQGIHSQILQRLSQNAIVSADADELNIGVNRRTARELVETIPTFQDQLTGKFSEDELNRILRNNDVSRAKFESDIYNDLRRQQTIPAMIGGLQAPKGFGDIRYKFLTEQRRAMVLTLNPRSVDSPADPDDETLQAYIDENAARYTAPAYRRVTMIRIENHDIVPDLVITEQAIRDEYDRQLDLGTLGTAETRSLAVLTADDETRARAAATQLAEGKDPLVVAEELGLIEPIFYADDRQDNVIIPEAGELAFTQEEGAASAVYSETFRLWYAVVTSNITPATSPDFETRKDIIKAELEVVTAQDQMFDITDAIQDGLDDSLTLEEIADATDGAYLSSYNFFSRQGAFQSGERLDGTQDVPGIGQDENILLEVFTAELGRETDMFETSNGGWATLRVDDILDPTLRPFEEVKDQATAAWKTERINEALDNLGFELAAQVEDGEKSLEDLTEEFGAGATLENITLVRSNPGQNIGPRVTVEILDGNLGDIARGDGALPLTRQIAKLTEIISNSDTLSGAQADQFNQQMNAALTNDILQAYTNAVLKDYPYKEYPENIRQALGLEVTQP